MPTLVVYTRYTYYSSSSTYLRDHRLLDLRANVNVRLTTNYRRYVPGSFVLRWLTAHHDSWLMTHHAVPLSAVRGIIPRIWYVRVHLVPDAEDMKHNTATAVPLAVYYERMYSSEGEGAIKSRSIYQVYVSYMYHTSSHVQQQYTGSFPVGFIGFTVNASEGPVGFRLRFSGPLLSESFPPPKVCGVFLLNFTCSKNNHKWIWNFWGKKTLRQEWPLFARESSRTASLPIPPAALYTLTTAVWLRLWLLLIVWQ